MQVSIVDSNALLLSALDSFSHLIKEKQLNIHFTPQGNEDNRLLFKTDSAKLELVMLNLLSNAIEFNHPGGSITVNLSLEEDHLLLSVIDTGIGLDMTQLDRLFDRFTQLESGIQKTHKGHGLGLSITKAVIDMMDGTVSVHSQPGKGCSVTLSIAPMETDTEADAFSVDGNEFFFGDDEAEMF